MRRNTSKGTTKHVPMRTCIACRKVKEKTELIRLVCNSDGIIEVDNSGKKTGRGAYLCRAIECWEEGLNRGKLEHALKSNIDQNKRESFLSWIREYLKENPESVQSL